MVKPANPKPELPGLREARKLLAAERRKPTDSDRPGVSTFPPQKAPPRIEGQLPLENEGRDE